MGNVYQIDTAALSQCAQQMLSLLDNFQAENHTSDASNMLGDCYSDMVAFEETLTKAEQNFVEMVRTTITYFESLGARVERRDTEEAAEASGGGATANSSGGGGRGAFGGGGTGGGSR